LNQVENKLDGIQPLADEGLIKFFFSIKKGWETVIIACAFGFSVGIAIFALTPARYDAIAIVGFAQALDYNDAEASTLNPKGIGIQNSAFIIEKLKLEPLSLEIVRACTNKGGENHDLEKYKTPDFFTISQANELGSYIRVKTYGDSKKQALGCLEIFVAHLIDWQNSVRKSYISELEQQLVEISSNKLKKSSYGALTKENNIEERLIYYISYYEQLQRESRKIAALKKGISFSTKNEPNLLGAITVSKSLALNSGINKIIGGFFGGLLLGLLIVFGRKAITHFAKQY